MFNVWRALARLANELVPLAANAARSDQILRSLEVAEHTCNQLSRKIQPARRKSQRVFLVVILLIFFFLSYAQLLGRVREEPINFILIFSVAAPGCSLCHNLRL